MRVPRDGVGLGVATLLMVGMDLGRRTFVNNDEARFPMLAQDVLDRGQWLLPHLNGQPYVNKPALLAWLIAAASWPVGHVTQLTAVLPSALAAAGTVLTLWAMGREMFGPSAGRYAALIALSTSGLVLHARLAMPDMLLTWATALSLWMFWAMIRGRHRWAWVGFYGGTAVAFWAKGPTGLLPLAVGAGWAVFAGRADRWRVLGPGRGLALLGVLVLPWWIAVLTAEPVVTRQVVMSDQLGWYMGGGLTLRNLTDPLRHLVGIAFPWTLVLPIVALEAIRFLRGRGPEREGVLLLLLWAAIVFALVALSSQQRLRYYLPLVPPLALLVGWWVAGVVVRHRRLRQIPWRLYGGLGAAVALALVATAVAGWGRKPVGAVFPASVGEGLFAVATLGVMVLALARGARQARMSAMFRVAWGAAALLLLVGYHCQVARENHASNYPRLAAHLRPWLRPEGRLVTVDVPELPLAFYAHRAALRLPGTTDLRDAVATEPPTIAVVRATTLARGDHQGLTVLGRARIGFRPVSVVGPPPASSSGLDP